MEEKEKIFTESAIMVALSTRNDAKMQHEMLPSTLQKQSFLIPAGIDEEKTSGQQGTLSGHSLCE